MRCVEFKQGSQLLQLRVDLGDGNDNVVNLTPPPMVANGSLGGGPGADHIDRAPPASAPGQRHDRMLNSGRSAAL